MRTLAARPAVGGTVDDHGGSGGWVAAVGTFLAGVFGLLKMREARAAKREEADTLWQKTLLERVRELKRKDGEREREIEGLRAEARRDVEAIRGQLEASRTAYQGLQAAYVEQSALLLRTQRELAELRDDRDQMRAYAEALADELTGLYRDVQSGHSNG